MMTTVLKKGAITYTLDIDAQETQCIFLQSKRIFGLIINRTKETFSTLFAAEQKLDSALESLEIKGFKIDSKN